MEIQLNDGAENIWNSWEHHLIYYTLRSLSLSLYSAYPIIISPGPMHHGNIIRAMFRRAWRVGRFIGAYNIGEENCRLRHTHYTHLLLHHTHTHTYYNTLSSLGTRGNCPRKSKPLCSLPVSDAHFSPLSLSLIPLLNDERLEISHRRLTLSLSSLNQQPLPPDVINIFLLPPTHPLSRCKLNLATNARLSLSTLLTD